MKTFITTILCAIALGLSAQMHHFHVSFDYKVDTADLVLDDTYVDGTGRNFSINTANYYVSNVRLVKDDNTEVDFSTYILVENHSTASDTNEFMVGMTGDDIYTGIKFDIGIDSATNHSDPTVHAAGDPLALQTPSMHWSWNSGYIFSRMEGMYDTTSAGTNAPNGVFTYHCGTMNMLREVELTFPTPVELTSNDGMLMVHVDLDILKVLDNVDLLTEHVTHTMNNMPLATKISNNLSAAFTATAMEMGTSSGITEFAKLEGAIFPNPATDQATLQFNNNGEAYTLRVADISGRLVMEQNNITGNQVQINTSVLNSGMYLVQLTGAAGNYSTRLLVR